MIELIHPALRNYRLELFDKLNEEYPVKFVFVEQQEGKEFGAMSIPESWKYENVNLKNSSAAWLRLAWILLRDNYKLILTSPAEMNYNFLALFVSKLRFKKIIFWGESWYWPSNTLLRRIYHHLLFKWMLEQGDAIIAMGEKQYSFYARVLLRNTGVFCAPKYVIPYKKRDASKLIEQLATEDRRIVGKKIILYMSQIITRKGLDYLIRAFKLLENKIDKVYLLIVGSGPFERYCKKLVKELDVKNVMFKGYVPESDIELYHNVCNVLVLPSIFSDDYPEPNGYVLYESMSVGKPLVVTDAVGAAPELVRDGVNGFVVRNMDTDELARALFNILVDEKLEERMSNRSKEIFDEKISLERQFEIFKTAIEYVQEKGHVTRDYETGHYRPPRSTR